MLLGFGVHRGNGGSPEGFFSGNRFLLLVHCHSSCCFMAELYVEICVEQAAQGLMKSEILVSGAKVRNKSIE